MKATEVAIRFFTQRLEFCRDHRIELTSEVLSTIITNTVLVALEAERDEWKRKLDELVEDMKKRIVMRLKLSEEMEGFRRAGTPENDGPCGHFEALCPALGRRLVIIASDGRGWSEPVPAPTERDLAMIPESRRETARAIYAGRKEIVLPAPVWEHVSVSTRITVPTWAEMCWVKEQFFLPTEWVVQFHPADVDHINLHDQVLHLWRLKDEPFPTPPKELV